MAVTTLVWNLENFGTRYGQSANGRAAETLRAVMVAAVVDDAGAQVLVIQELRKQGIGLLPTLRNCLNAVTPAADWHWDWIPGSVRNAVAIPPAGFANLNFTQMGNSEGYAVLYRQGYVLPQGVARSAGQDTGPAGGGGGGNFIDIVVAGQTLVFNPAEPVITFGAPAGADLGFPQSLCPTANIVRGTRKRALDAVGGGVYRSNDVIPLQYLSRRAVQLTIGEGGANGFPLVAYHSPVGQKGSPSSYYGALIGFACASLQAANVAYCGDLNVVKPAEQGHVYNRATGLAYGSLTYDNVANEFIKTSVHAATRNAPRAWHGAGTTVTSARDYGFAKGAPAVDVPPVLTWIGDNTKLVNQALHFGGVQATLTNRILPLSVFTNKFPGTANQVIAGYYAGGGYPAGADADTAAALMFNLTLSDHLPVRVTR